MKTGDYIPKLPVKPEWEDAPSWANYLAFDKTHHWHWLENPPEYDEFGVICATGIHEIVTFIPLVPEDHFEQRPEHIEDDKGIEEIVEEMGELILTRGKELRKNIEAAEKVARELLKDTKESATPVVEKKLEEIKVAGKKIGGIVSDLFKS